MDRSFSSNLPINGALRVLAGLALFGGACALLLSVGGIAWLAWFLFHHLVFV